ncbi:MAG: flagellar protein FlaG, partial [Synergistaceae bacterium]|nr:flagellar protein FlaG [Synergistaceae bacterium]
SKERAKDKELSREELKAILEKTAEISKIFNSKRKIKYEVIEEADLVQIQVIDTDDGEIIRKIPADEIVELVKKLHEVLSERLDVKA